MLFILLQIIIFTARKKVKTHQQLKQNGKILDQSSNHWQRFINYLNDTKSIFNHLHDGIAFFNLNDDFQCVFSNRQILNCLNLDDEQNIFDTMYLLKNINIIENDWDKKLKGENRININNSISMMLGTKKQKSFNISLVGLGGEKDQEELFDKGPQSSIRENKHYQVDQSFLEQITFEGIIQQIKKKIPQLQQEKSEMIQLFKFSAQIQDKQQKDEDVLEIKIYFCKPNMNESDYLLLIQIKDISYIKQIQQLTEQDKAKSNQLNFVSHEFRNPLGCIIAMLQYYQQNDNNNQQNRINYLDTAIGNCKFLLNLTNDLLDMAQIRVGKFKLKKSSFSLQKLFFECIAMHYILAQQKGLKLNYYIDKKIDIIFQDENRIKQIIINLISNAFKFTVEGSIELYAKIIDENLIIIEVNDTGFGIPDNQQNKLFKAFSQVDSIENKQVNKSGVGLGLVISNSIAQCLNKKKKGIMFESRQGKGLYNFFNMFLGSKFFFHLNFEKQILDESWGINHQQLSIQQIKSFNLVQSQELSDIFEVEYEQSTPQKIYPSKQILVSKPKVCYCQKILIVDDNYFNLQVLKILLKKECVDLALRGEDAIQLVKNKLSSKCCKKYDLIILDLEMPSMDGFQTFQQINQIQQSNCIKSKIVACSGYSKEKERQKCLQFGMDDYLEKPIKPEKLKKLLQEI